MYGTKSEIFELLSRRKVLRAQSELLNFWLYPSEILDSISRID